MPGRNGSRRASPRQVKVHDFPDKKLGKAIPYGVYDLASNEGWVSVGIDHDTAQFAAASIGRWWRRDGHARVSQGPSELLITADGGGSNSSRSRLWKVALQELAERPGPGLAGLPFSAGHQQVEQDRASAVLFHHQELARPSADQLPDHRESHRQHHDQTGLTVRAALDTNQYETGIEVSDEELANVNCLPARFHGEWNYTIRRK